MLYGVTTWTPECQERGALSGQGAVRLHDHVAGAPQIQRQVVVQHRRHLRVLQQREVLGVQVVGDERPAGPPGVGEGGHGRALPPVAYIE